MLGELLHLNHIRIAGNTQFRDGLHEETVERYREMYVGNPAALPPIALFRTGDKGPYFVGDGHHRIEAFKRAYDMQFIQADVREGTLEDARVYSAMANLQHGRSLTAEERRRVFEFIISLPENAKKSARTLGEELGCCDMTIKRIRHSLSSTNVEDAPVRTATRKGKTYTMDTSGIGKIRKIPLPRVKSSASAASPPPVPISPLPDPKLDKCESDAASELSADLRKVVEEVVLAVSTEKSTCFACEKFSVIGADASPEDAAVMLREFWGEETERFVAALAQEIREERR